MYFVFFSRFCNKTTPVLQKITSTFIFESNKKPSKLFTFEPSKLQRDIDKKFEFFMQIIYPTNVSVTL
jgi:hypothetical protein